MTCLVERFSGFAEVYNVLLFIDKNACNAQVELGLYTNIAKHSSKGRAMANENHGRMLIKNDFQN